MKKMEKMNRRQFLKVLGRVSIAYTGAAVIGYEYGRQVEAERVVIEKVRIPLKNLKPALAGFKIVQMSDFHIEPFTQVEVIRKGVALANSLQPDITVLTGDYVTDKAEAISDLAPILAGLKARYGVFACLGNHDLWTNSAIVRAGLEEAGLRVLVNEGSVLDTAQGMVYVAGVDDGWSGQPDLGAALNKLPADTPVILLAHEPDFADTFCQDGRVSLQLSGHSHGGQVRLPGLGAIILPSHGRKYSCGLYQVNGMWVYTNRGLGVMPIPCRINCPPEVTEITLAQKS
jgi:predicted MPP superfamily phosphohydrolase